MTDESVPIGELEALVEEWQEGRKRNREQSEARTGCAGAMRLGVSHCENRLQELIEGHKE